MNDQETFFEQNLERLLRKSCGPETRLPPTILEKARQKLLAELCCESIPAQFPTPVLGVLSGLLLLLVSMCATASWTRGWLPIGHMVMGPFAALVLLNLLALPVASLVIILRRRYV